MSNTPRNLTRDQLAEFLPNARAIKAFEQILNQLSNLLPADIQAILMAVEEINIGTTSADTKATQCLDALSRIADSLEILALAPYAQQGLPQDDLTPPTTLGTLGQQQSDNVSITGGSVLANLTTNQTTLMKSSVALSNAAAASIATMTNAPIAGNPTKWVSINDNGTTRRIPTW